MTVEIILALALLVAIFIVLVSLRSDKYLVERSLLIAAPASTLFPLVNDHQNFNRWNPFLKMDPQVKNTLSGPRAGVGAVCAWEGNRQIGAGSSTIIESKPDELVRMHMDWIRPMKGIGTMDFTFKAEGPHTLVTWAMYGRRGFAGKLFSLCINCDKMCGPKFAEGLVNLSQLAKTSN